jgi:hypothetical protein
MMKDIGTNVWATFGGTLRFGTIIEERVEDNGWRYVRCKWVDDHKFEADRAMVLQLRHYDKYSDWYRVDKIHALDTKNIIGSLSKLEGV